MKKNWLLFKQKNKFLFICKLCPICKIYELNLTNYKMKKYIEFDTKEILNKYDYLFKNISTPYKDLYLSPACEIISNSDDIYNLIVKVKHVKCYYCYYKLILNLSEKKIDILPDLLFSGKKYFLNDSFIYNNRVIGCFGVKDKNYEIKYLDL